MTPIAAMAFAAGLPPIAELRWTAPGAEFQALSRQPPACFDQVTATEPLVRTGQALFNSPAILGGQAAKAGLSCASCHVNGRGNSHFMMANVSDRAGTADVTNSFFGVARGNGRFDPVAIPDLAAPGKISRDSATAALEPFLRNLVVEEFSGAEPEPVVIAALAAYVRAIRPCPAKADVETGRGLGDQLLLVRAATQGATLMAQRGDRRTAHLLVAAARHQLGLISERYAGPQLGPDRKALLAASRDLQALTGPRIDLATLMQKIDRWQRRFDQGLAGQLAKSEPHSLFAPDKLRGIFAAPLQ